MMHRAVIIAIIFLSLTSAAARAEGPITLVEYQHVVEQALQLVNQAERSFPEQRPALLKQAANLLSTVREVQLDSGDRISVNNETLVGALNDASQDSQRLYWSGSAAARLLVLRTALAEPPAAASESDLKKLHDIFDRPPFKRSEVDSLLRQLVRQFNAWLDGLLNRSVGGMLDQRDFITWLGVAMTLVVLVFFIRNLRRNLAAEEELKITEGGEEVVTSHAALTNAQRLASAGDYRSAVRMLYLATLLLLDERGRLRYDKSLTNREYLRALKDEPAVADALKPIVETFDRTWYGFEGVTPDQFAEYAHKVEEVRKL